MPNTVLGKVSVTPKGAWSGSSSYEKMDIVSNGGNSYIALQNVPSGTALSNSSYWLMIAQKGDKGNTGEITGASASISGGYGTPSVSVTSGGTSTDRSFAFAFSNLKGNGISSVNCEKTATSGAVDTYTLTITEDDGTANEFELEVTNGSVTSVNGRTGAVTGLAEQEDLIKAFPNDTASGDIASFPDGADMPVKGMKINVEPYQNLNGYEYPWVGGANKNLADLSDVRTSKFILSTASIGSVPTLSDSTASDVYAKIGYVESGQAYILSYNRHTPTSSGVRYGAICDGDDKVVENNIVTWHPNAYVSFTPSTSGWLWVTIDKSSTEIQLEKGSSATSYVPYSNICPIYPANGKNLFNGNFIDGNNYIDATSGSAINATSTPEYRCTDYIDCSAWQGMTITLNHGARGSSPGIAFYNSSKVYISGVANSNATVGIPHTYTVPSTAYYLRFTTVVDYVNECQLELGDTPTAYVPYKSIATRRSGMRWDSSSVGHYLDENGNVGNSNNFHYSEYLPVKSGTHNYQFYYSGGNSGAGFTTRVHGYDENKNWVRQLTALSGINTVSTYNAPFITTDDIAYVRISNSVFTDNDYQAIMPDFTEYYYSRDYNMWDEEWEVGRFNETTGEKTDGTSNIRSKNYIPVDENTQYYMKLSTTAGLLFYDAEKNFISPVKWQIADSSFTTPVGTRYMMFYVNSNYGTTYNHDIIINYSNPSQVGYGGVLDVDTGLLTITHNIVDLGSLTWSYDSSQTCFYSSNVPNCISFVYAGSAKPPYLSSNYTPIPVGYNAGDGNDLTLWGRTNQQSVRIRNTAYTDATTFKNTLSGMQFVYPLATPVQYQLTPTQVKTLLGYNNIWTDSGTVEVNYLADTSLYIQKLTGSTEEDMIANANIENGKYFMVGNELFLSTSAIAQGASIVVGINCIKTNLADALNALNS